MNHNSTFKLNDFLTLLYSLSNKRFYNQQHWFRTLFYSYHLDCDKLECAMYHTAQCVISDTLNGKATRKLPLRLYQYYFSSKDGLYRLYDDLCSYLCKVTLTEGSRQHYISLLTESIQSATNINPRDIQYILSSKQGSSLLEQLGEMCYKIISALA